VRVLIFILLLSGVARADDVAVPLQHDGKDGVWFVLKEAQRLNVLDELAPLKENKIRLLDRQLELAKIEIVNVRIAVDATNERADLWERTALKVEARADTVQAKLDAWYRQPVVLFTVGALVGATAAVVLR